MYFFLCLLLCISYIVLLVFLFRYMCIIFFIYIYENLKISFREIIESYDQ